MLTPSDVGFPAVTGCEMFFFGDDYGGDGKSFRGDVEGDGGGCGNDSGTCSVNCCCDGKGFHGDDKDAEERFSVGLC